MFCGKVPGKNRIYFRGRAGHFESLVAPNSLFYHPSGHQFWSNLCCFGPGTSFIKRPQRSKYRRKKWKEIEKYKQKAGSQAEELRTAETRKKPRVFTGLYAINQLNNYKMPVYVADYVLGNVGTGAVVGVPGHDKRDFEFAKEFNLEVKRVVQKSANDIGSIDHIDKVQEEAGTMVNSEFLNGLNIHDATAKIMDFMEAQGYGKKWLIINCGIGCFAPALLGRADSHYPLRRLRNCAGAGKRLAG